MSEWFSRYRLQRKEVVARPNILGNHSMPVYTYQWKDVAVCGERKPLEQMLLRCAPQEKYRIEDTISALTKPQEEGAK